MSIKQVTVFGGSGFIGRAIVRALAQEGLQVRVAVRRIELAESLKTAGDVGQITVMRTNLRMPQSVAAATNFGQTSPEAINMLRAYYRWQVITDLVSPYITTIRPADGSMPSDFLIVATTAFKNEKYP